MVGCRRKVESGREKRNERVKAADEGRLKKKAFVDNVRRERKGRFAGLPTLPGILPETTRSLWGWYVRLNYLVEESFGELVSECGSGLRR